MNNIITLLKVDFKGTLDTRKFKENKAKSTSFFTFLILFGLLFLFISVIYNLMFTMMFVQAGESLVYSTLMMAGLAVVLTFSTSVFKVKSIFMGKDYEMLKAMPVKNSDIISSKIISLYLVELLYSAIILIPNTIINIIFSKNLIYLPTGLLLTVFTPAVPMLLSCFFAMFISLVADRYKFGNVINVILYMVLFAAIFSFSFMMNTSNPSEGEEFDITSYINMANILSYLNPTLFLVKLSILNNYAYILLFVLANILLFIASVLIIALLFNPIYVLINSFSSNNVYIQKPLEVKSQFKALFYNESKRFFTSKFYFINSLASGICALLMAIFMGYMFSPYSTMIPHEEGMSEFFSYYGFCGTIIIIFGIGIATPAATSISIEGNKFWMLKTFPIDYKKLVNAKILLSSLVLGACAIISSIVLCVFLNATIYSYIMCTLISVMYVILASIIGLRINLSHYKLKWKNEQECVKSSSGAVLSMLADFGAFIVVAGLVIGLSFINIYLAGIITLVVIMLLSYILYITMIKHVDYKFSKIEDF